MLHVTLSNMKMIPSTGLDEVDAERVMRSLGLGSAEGQTARVMTDEEIKTYLEEEEEA